MLELTYNHGVDSYDLGTGYNHIALAVDDLDGTLEALAAEGIEPEKPPYRARTSGRSSASCATPTGYRIEILSAPSRAAAYGSNVTPQVVPWSPAFQAAVSVCCPKNALPSTVKPVPPEQLCRVWLWAV